MSDEQQVQTEVEVLNAFYPDDNAEPLEAPTEESASDEVPAELEADEVESEEAETEDEASEGESEDDNVDGDSDNLVYEINGKDYTAKDIERLETDDKSRQADYTRKTQALAEDVKTLESAVTKTNDLAAELEVLVNEDAEINWDELQEDDPDEYIRLDKRRNARQSKLAEIKANNASTAKSSFDPETERSKLVAANPHWLDGDKPTQAYQDDMKSLSGYYEENGVTQEEAQFISQNARIVQLVLEDAKRKAESKSKTVKKASAKKKIIATPKSGKVKAGANNQTAEEIFYGKN